MIRRVKNTVKYLMSLVLAFTLCAASFAGPSAVYAAETSMVTVGAGTYASEWLPYDNRDQAARTQVIYRAQDIGTDGAIVSIAYNVANATGGLKLKSLKVWMGYTDLDSYVYEKTGYVASSEYTMRESDLNLVYSGSPEIGKKTGWETLTLDEPFAYKRSYGNLVIVTAAVSAAGDDADIRYYCTDYDGDSNQKAVTALIGRGYDDARVADLSYSGNKPWIIKSLRPNLRLEFDRSGGGEVTKCDVSFDVDGGEPVPATQSVPKGEKLTKPEDPSKEGYRFAGWYKDGSEYDFNKRVYSTFTLKASWTKVHEISFVNWDGTLLQSGQIDDGAKPEFTGDTPYKAAEDGKTYVFAGWDPAIKEADGPQTYTAVFVDETELADKTELQKELDASRDALTGVKISEDGSDVGSRFRYVSAEVRKAIDDARDAAQKVADDPFAKQPDADKATEDLKAAHAAFVAAQKYGTKELPRIAKIVIGKESGRQQPACGGKFVWIVTFEEGTDLTAYPDNYFDDDFQIQRKPAGSDWKNSRCPTHSFTRDDSDADIKNVGIVEGLAIPDNDKPTDTPNQWRFIYAGDFVDDSVIWPVISQEGYSRIDKEALKAAISDAQDAQNGIKVSASGLDVSPQDLYVTPSEKKELDDAISAAQAVYDDAKTTQQKIDEACSTLIEASEKFIKAKKAGREEEEKRYAPGDYRLVYETEKLKLPDMPVRLRSAEGSYDWFTDRELSFEFYDSTTQTIDGVYTTKEAVFTDGDGKEQRAQVLSDVSMVRSHSYIVSVYDKEYMIPNYYTVTIDDDGSGGSGAYTSNMINYYIELNGKDSLPTNIKDGSRLHYFDVMQRSTPLADAADAKRVNVSLPVYYTRDGTSSTILTRIEDATIKLTSPLETLYVTSSSSGVITAALIEDINYMVQIVDAGDAVAVQPFPLTVKDHAENGWPKSIYNHFSCGSVQGIYLVDKQYEHSKDTTLASPSKKTTVTGLNFLNTRETDTDHYFIYDTRLDNSSVDGLSGRDYEVFKVEAINMYRTEISKLAAGSFKISRAVPAGKSVYKVCYKNKAGKLKELAFTEADGKVTFTMNTLSMYPNVIIYKATSKPAVKNVSVNINKKTVNAAAVKAAIAKAGSNVRVTQVVLGKKVKKISKGAFAGTSVKTVVIKSKKLSKKAVKGSLYKSKVATVKVKIGKVSVNKKYVKKYKKIFTKKNAGRSAKVKR